MKRLPIVLTLLALIALAASLAYWVLQLYKPAQRPIAAAPVVAAAEPSVDAAATLFGGQASAAVATNYQLTGVVAAGADSVAILAATGQPPKAVRVGRELMPGVTVSEVHARHVMLSDGGVMKRIDLPADTKGAAAAAGGNLPAAGAPPGGEPPLAPGAVAPAAPDDPNLGIVRGHEEQPSTPAPAQPAAPAGNAAPAVQAPVQMPPPVRSPGSPVNQPPVSR
ncbi:MAG TPA: type II secretion system protein N [Albitalea sp.]|nr:type II secretion system protein N [Albitalea sp.]